MRVKYAPLPLFWQLFQIPLAVRRMYRNSYSLVVLCVFSHVKSNDNQRKPYQFTFLTVCLTRKHINFKDPNISFTNNVKDETEGTC